MRSRRAPALLGQATTRRRRTPPGGGEAAGPGTSRTRIACLLLYAAAIAPPSATAQGVGWGPRIGLNLSAVRYADGGAMNGVEIKPGLHLGAATMLATGRHASMEASIVVSQDGFRGEGTHPGDVNMDYLDIAVAGVLRLPARVAPHLLMGVTGGYMIRCRLTDVPIVGETACDDRLVGTRWRAFDVGAIGGVGGSVPTSRGRLRLDLLASFGIRDLKDDLLPPGAARRAALRLALTLFPSREDTS